MEYTEMKKLTEEQRMKLQALYEAENPRPRNRAERRAQERRKNKNVKTSTKKKL